MNPFNQCRCDGQASPFTPGQTIMDAALAAGVYIPHLCHNPELPPHGSCRVCVVRAGGRPGSARPAPAAGGPGGGSAPPGPPARRRTPLPLPLVRGHQTCPPRPQPGALLYTPYPPPTGAM